MTIFQYFNLAGIILGDVSEFAAGKPVASTQTLGKETISVATTQLPKGPADTPYQVIEGRLEELMFFVFADLTGFVGGAPILVAFKVNKTWVGVTFSLAKTDQKPA